MRVNRSLAATFCRSPNIIADPSGIRASQMNERRGSCLCGKVRFSVAGEIRGVGSCHCSKCRKVSGGNGNAVFIVPMERLRWIAGEGDVKVFALADGWGVSRCRDCGSPVPSSFDGRQMWVHAGLMDDSLGTDVKRHIFCASRADWDRESPDATFHDEYPS